MDYYEINHGHATVIGKFAYQLGFGFDPFVAEQQNNHYLVREDMFLLLQNTPQFQNVNFNVLNKITEIIAKQNLK